MKFRITGTEDEVTSAARRVGDLFTVLETSRLYPRRGESRLVSVYIEAGPPPTPSGGQYAALKSDPGCPLCGSACRWDGQDFDHGGDAFTCLSHGHAFTITQQGDLT
jgi:hypothetical protein